MRFFLTVTAALALVSLTGFNAVCSALFRFGLPRPFVLQLMFFYRYMFVLSDEAESMSRARLFRTGNSRPMGMKTFIPLIGHLLLRALSRAERIYRAMRCRGFDGDIRIVRDMKLGLREVCFVFGWSILFIFFRFYNLPLKLGELISGAIR